MGQEKDKAFLICFLLSFALTGSVLYFNLARLWQWLNALLHKPAGVGSIAFLVLWLNLWVVFFLIVRCVKTANERTLIDIASGEIPKLPAVPDLDRHLSENLKETWRLLYDESQLKARLQLWRARLHDFNRSDRLSFLMMGQAGIESARIDSIYGPLRALVWALPGLGFMGTAMEMSEAIKKVGAIGSGKTDELLASLTTGVIPALGGAFQITLFALGSSVVCFVLLSLAHRREEKILHSADALSLQLLASVADERPVLKLNDESSRYLATGLRDLRTTLQVLSFQLENLGSIAPDDPMDDEQDGSSAATGRR
jgi:hypothetical protein